MDFNPYTEQTGSLEVAFSVLKCIGKVQIEEFTLASIIKVRVRGIEDFVIRLEGNGRV